jgi:uncharacterized protein involved in exopolysaccharide biosynthesis
MLGYLDAVRELGRRLFQGAEAQRGTAVMTEFLKRLSVKPRRGSAVISVQFTSVNAEKAAAIANSGASTQLAMAKAERTAAEARLTHLQRALRTPSGIEAMPDVTA